MSAKSKAETEPTNETCCRRHQCTISGVWARSSPEAAKRGVRDAGLEVGHIPRDHRSAVWSFIASDMSDRSSADLYRSSCVRTIWPVHATVRGDASSRARSHGRTLSALPYPATPRTISDHLNGRDGRLLQNDNQVRAGDKPPLHHSAQLLQQDKVSARRPVLHGRL